MRLIPILTVALLLAGGAHAAAHAADWVADPAASKLGFSGMQVGAPFTGTFKSLTARISFDPARPQAGHAHVSIDLASAVTGDTQRDTALPQPEWFDTKRFATATFDVTSFVPRGGDRYDAVGRLTLRDVTRDLTLPLTITLAGDTAHATGHVDLLRSTFGVGQGAWASEDYVAFKVGVDIDLVARKAP
jgi:polyisoprenoid-binding protein YceI